MRLTICAIFRDEARYLGEWIEFHLLQGVEHFTLYQHRSEDDWPTVLGPYIMQGLVTIIDWNMDNPSQFAAYQHFIDSHHQPEWAAFIDIDEFLFSPEYPKVTEVLDRFPEEWGAVGVNWMCFGSSGLTGYSPELVTSRFTKRGYLTDPVNQHIKSIVRMNQRAHVGGTPHHFETEHGTFTESGEELHGPFSRVHSSQLLRLNHYSSKTHEEWVERKKHGLPDRADRSIDPAWYTARQGMEVEDLAIQRFLPELKRRLG